MTDSDDEQITLPEDTLKILKHFLNEKAKRERQEQEIVAEKTGKGATFEEDWV